MPASARTSIPFCASIASGAAQAGCLWLETE
jgi:hypothetical protein